jgi:hypothetical protein
MNARPLSDRIIAALLWATAFCFATGLFLSLTLFFPSLPPTKPVAIGIVTILRYPKLKDYLAIGLFFLTVPPLTILFHRYGSRLVPRRNVPAILFLSPYLLAPFFYLTTGKAGWILALPVALSLLAPRALEAWESRRWLREMFREELRPYHALLFCEAVSWILFRYLVTGRRIAHIPTLLLEVVFVGTLIALFWVVALFITRMVKLQFGIDVFRQIVTAAIPLVVLPFLPLFWIPTTEPRLAILVALLLAALIAMRIRTPLSPRGAWRLSAFVILPALIYLVSYTSTAYPPQAIDLFHRGESIGPASDYLRGKVPFRDTFPLHGMLEDGLLDSWLMQLFGRSVDVAIASGVILGGFLSVSIWFLGLAVFESIPLAMLCVAMGAWTTAENSRTFFQVAAVALFWNALKRRSRWSAVFSGVFAGVAIFFSYEIGLYTIVAAIIVLVVERGRLVRSDRASRSITERRRARRPTTAAGTAALPFFIGVALGAAPFVIYLIARDALADFAVTSFITIPNIIDAVWSLPFPDLVSTFRDSLNLHTLADFVLFEKFHLILSPLTIAVAAVYLIQRWLRHRIDTFDSALLVLTVFAAVTQRTAFGRAEFRHQYFAAFLVGPMLVMLAILFTRKLRETVRDGGSVFVATLVVVLVPVIGVLLWIPDLVNARIDDVINYQRRVLHIFRDGHAEEVAFRIDAVSDEIHKLTKRNEPIFDFSNQPAFYFFANRPNPTRFYQVPILSPREFQAETIRVLDRTKPKVIIRTSPEQYDRFDGVPNAIRAQAVAAYIDDCYRFYKSVRGVELWKRLDAAKPLPVAQYLRRIRLPRPAELVESSRDRELFPLVGNHEGINGARWVSDLTMHNPFREPITMSLRYVAGDVRIDRSVKLAPRQTVRWPDVARTLFGTSDAIGTLWIEHRVGRAPVAMVKTFDAAHDTHASVEQPLTARDSATAGGDAAELTIVGIPDARTARRVNIGIVNTGTIPATFHISVRGKSIEQGIAEDEVWIVPDIEHQLGVTLDESVIIRITPVAGSGVAFASVVDVNGDNQFIAAVPAQQQ